MKRTVFLIVNGQTGECRVRKTLSASPLEYVFRVDLEIPTNPVPTVTIKIPVPSAPAVVTEVKDVPFGIPWAISQNLVCVTGLTDKGAIILDYTDEGITKLLSELGAPQREVKPWDLHQYAQKRYGIPFTYIEPDRWDSLSGQKEPIEQTE